MGIKIPSKIRWVTNAEYSMVYRVFGSSLPMSSRIFVTDGAGLEGRPFTIPFSLLSTLGATVVGGFVGLLGGYLTSGIANLAYFINAGDFYRNSFAVGDQNGQNMFIHEMTHVWQGYNSTIGLSYVFNSCISQCVLGKRAYNYQVGQDWSSYNVEQQAHIVEDWYYAGMPNNGDLVEYVQKYVRNGKT